jgi:hypothetical protein
LCVNAMLNVFCAISSGFVLQTGPLTACGAASLADFSKASIDKLMETFGDDPREMIRRLQADTQSQMRAVAFQQSPLGQRTKTAIFACGAVDVAVHWIELHAALVRSAGKAHWIDLRRRQALLSVAPMLLPACNLLKTLLVCEGSEAEQEARRASMAGCGALEALVELVAAFGAVTHESDEDGAKRRDARMLRLAPQAAKDATSPNTLNELAHEAFCERILSAAKRAHKKRMCTDSASPSADDDGSGSDDGTPSPHDKPAGFALVEAFMALARLSMGGASPSAAARRKRLVSLNTVPLIVDAVARNYKFEAFQWCALCLSPHAQC